MTDLSIFQRFFVGPDFMDFSLGCHGAHVRADSTLGPAIMIAQNLIILII